MISPRDTFLYRLWFLVVIILVAANLILLAMHLSGTYAISLSSGDSKATLDSIDVAASKFSHGVRSSGQAISNSEQAVTTAVNRSVKLAGRSIQNGADSVGRGLAGSAVATIHGMGHVMGRALNLAIVSSLIRPAQRVAVPVITPLPGISKVVAMQTVSQIIPQTDPAAQWPIHGAVTTLFGASDWPYERVHTGIDISDGRSPGITPVRPFKPGRVAEVIRSGGLGNHVIVDHGGGMTSVYGHLYSIAVQVGQPVDESTILGYEGSTGASTGTHLHFETRINGQPENPQKFISGHP